MMGKHLNWPNVESATTSFSTVGPKLQRRMNERKVTLLVANNKIDMLPDPWRVELFEKSFREEGSSMYVVPIAATVGLSELESQEYFQRMAEIADSVVFAGGDDIDPAIFGQKPIHASNTNLLRDQYELKMFKWLHSSQSVYLVGVCRGHQLMLAALDSRYSIVQDIEVMLGLPSHSDTEHHISWHPVGNFIDDLYQGLPNRQSNSLHHQAFFKIPTDGPVHVNAVDQYGIVEGTVLKNQMGFTVQFHPEKMEGVRNIFARIVLKGSEQFLTKVTTSTNTSGVTLANVCEVALNKRVSNVQ